MADVKQLPPIGKLDAVEAKRRFTDDLFYFNHPLWLNDFSNDRRAELYDQGSQWLQSTMMGYGGTTRSNWISVYYDANDPRYTPTPVFNEGFGTRTNESARLGRPNYRPTVTPISESVTYPMRVNAKNATRAIRARMKELEWDKFSNLLYYHLPVYGGAWVKSEWVLKWDKTTMVPSTTAAQCPAPGCGFKTSSSQVPFTALQSAGLGNASVTAASSTTARVDSCLTCPDSPKLMPYSPTMEEAQKGKDSLGQPMGNPQPMGDWECSVRVPYNMFPRDLGFDMEPGKVDEWSERHIEKVDWCYLRYANAPKIKELVAESPAELAKYHPMLGTPDIYGTIIDNKILRDSVAVCEYHRKPWLEMVTDENTGEKNLRFNQGRSFVLANNVLLFDGPYMMESATQPGTQVPRVVMDYIPWELRDGGRRLSGMSLWELLFDPQDARNEITAQTQSVRQRMALPIYWGLKSWKIDRLSTMNGVPGQFWFGEVDPASPNAKPEVINNTTIDAGVKSELQDAIDAIPRYGGFSQTEKGDVPPGVTAALAIQYLKTFAAEGREPRLARIKATLGRVWDHAFTCMKAFYLEDRKVEFEDDENNDELASQMVNWQAMDVDANIKVDADADFDDKAKNQQVVMDMLQSGVFDLQDPNVRREVARIVEIPDELFKKWDIQRQSAEKEYLNYRKLGTVPVRDPGVDDDQIHFDQHGIDAQSEWMLEQERLAQWDTALKILGAAWDQINFQIQNRMGPPMVCIEDQLKMFWQMALEQGGFVPPVNPQSGMPDPAQQKAFQYVFNWHAHTQGHKLAGEMVQMQAQQSPTLAAPGSPEETAAGNVPTSGAPPDAGGQGGAPAAPQG